VEGVWEVRGKSPSSSSIKQRKQKKRGKTTLEGKGGRGELGSQKLKSLTSHGESRREELGGLRNRLPGKVVTRHDKGYGRKETGVRRKKLPQSKKNTTEEKKPGLAEKKEAVL